MSGFRPGTFAIGGISNICQSKAGEVFTHVIASVFPNRQQNALTFMVA
jgi:hypothetical protein